MSLRSPYRRRQQSEDTDRVVAYAKMYAGLLGIDDETAEEAEHARPRLLAHGVATVGTPTVSGQANTPDPSLTGAVGIEPSRNGTRPSTGDEAVRQIKPQNPWPSKDENLEPSFDDRKEAL